MARKRITKEARNPSSPDSTAARILAAADRLMCTRGFEGTSMGAIAKEAEVNKALVFYYFGNKDQLFDVILDRYYQTHKESLQEVLATAEGPPRERFHRLIDGYLDFIEENIAYPRLVQQEIARKGGHHARIRDNLGSVYAVVEQALVDVAPDTGPLSAKHFYITFSGAVISYYTYAPVMEGLWKGNPLSGEARQERREHIHWLVDALLHALVGERQRA